MVLYRDYHTRAMRALKAMSPVEKQIRLIHLALNYYDPNKGWSLETQQHMKKRLEPLFKQISYLQAQESRRDWFGQFEAWLNRLPDKRLVNPQESKLMYQQLDGLLREWGDVERAVNQRKIPDTSRAMEYIQDMVRLVNQERIAKGTIVYDKPRMTISFTIGKGSSVDKVGNKVGVLYKGSLQYDKRSDTYNLWVTAISDFADILYESPVLNDVYNDMVGEIFGRRLAEARKQAAAELKKFNALLLNR